MSNERFVVAETNVRKGVQLHTQMRMESVLVFGFYILR
jgi:hypothetical protein